MVSTRATGIKERREMIKQMGNMEDLIDEVGKSGLIEGKEFQSLGNQCFHVIRNIKIYIIIIHSPVAIIK